MRGSAFPRAHDETTPIIAKLWQIKMSNAPTAKRSTH